LTICSFSVGCFVGDELTDAWGKELNLTYKKRTMRIEIEKTTVLFQQYKVVTMKKYLINTFIIKDNKEEFTKHH